MKCVNPYTSMLPYGIAGLLTAGTWLLVLLLKATPLAWLWGVFNDRGPFPLASLYCFYLNTLALILWRKNSAAARPAAVFLCVLPLLLGLGGTLHGYHLLATDVCTLLNQALAGGADLISWHGVVDHIRAGIRAAWDPAIFGGMLSGANYLLFQRRISSALA